MAAAAVAGMIMVVAPTPETAMPQALKCPEVVAIRGAQFRGAGSLTSCFDHSDMGASNNYCEDAHTKDLQFVETAA